MDFFQEQFQQMDLQIQKYKEEFAELVTSNYLEINFIDGLEC